MSAENPETLSVMPEPEHPSMDALLRQEAIIEHHSKTGIKFPDGFLADLEATKNADAALHDLIEDMYAKCQHYTEIVIELNELFSHEYTDEQYQALVAEHAQVGDEAIEAIDLVMQAMREKTPNEDEQVEVENVAKLFKLDNAKNRVGHSAFSMNLTFKRIIESLEDVADEQVSQAA